MRTAGNPESPFVLRHEGKYYLWQQMSVYASDDPLDFNHAPLVAHMTGLWYNGRYAPEIVQDGGQWYVAGYSRGLHVARFTWQRKTEQTGKNIYDVPLQTARREPVAAAQVAAPGNAVLPLGPQDQGHPSGTRACSSPR